MVETKGKRYKSIFLKELRTWAESTSVVGPKAIYYTHMLPFMQIIWVFFFVIASSITVYLYWKDIVKYQKKLTTSTSTQSVVLDDLTFPLVTICPLNPVQQSLKNQKAALLEKAYEQYFEKDKNIEDMCKSKLFSTRLCDLMKKTPSRYGESVMPDSPMLRKIGGESTVRAQLKLLFRYFIASMTDAEIEEFSGSKLENMLIQCHFNGHPCDHTKFKKIRSLEYGMCLTFHNPNSTANYLPSGYKTKSAQPGVPFGLLVDLFSYPNKTLNFLDEEEGFVVKVHEAGTIPYSQISDNKIPLGEVTTITVKENSFRKCDAAECNDCIDDKMDEEEIEKESVEKQLAFKAQKTLKEKYEKLENHRITFNDCVFDCASQIINKKCGCRIPVSPFQSVQKKDVCTPEGGNGRDSACALGYLYQVKKLAEHEVNKRKNEKDASDETIQKLKKDFGGEYKACNCMPLCERTTYDEDHFYSRFPWQPAGFDDKLADMNNVFNQLVRSSKPFYDIVGKRTREKKKCNGTDENCFGQSSFPLEGKEALDEDEKIRLIQQSVTRLHVHFRSMRRTTTEESLKYRITDMLSDMGSQGGMWLGLNILTVLVFVELMISLLVHFIISLVKHIKTKMCSTKFERQQEKRKALIKSEPKRFVEIDIPIKADSNVKQTTKVTVKPGRKHAEMDLEV